MDSAHEVMIIAAPLGIFAVYLLFRRNVSEVLLSTPVSRQWWDITKSAQNRICSQETRYEKPNNTAWLPNALPKCSFWERKANLPLFFRSVSSSRLLLSLVILLDLTTWNILLITVVCNGLIASDSLGLWFLWARNTLPRASKKQDYKWCLHKTMFVLIL